MFYSHTILARKSPLGTVWIAAHLERKIKKPQIDGIDIPSYAECIMFPEVPIALRLSGHLLLGLVRIYSWKVNYLFQDCNRMLTTIRTAFASVQVDLPIDADRAPFEAITLPDTFNLDDLNLDDAIRQIDTPDNHRKTPDQITLTEGEYVMIDIDEDARVEPSAPGRSSCMGPEPTVDETLPPFDIGFEPSNDLHGKSSVEPPLGNLSEKPSSINQTNEAQDPPEIMRKASSEGPELNLSAGANIDPMEVSQDGSPFLQKIITSPITNQALSPVRGSLHGTSTPNVPGITTDDPFEDEPIHIEYQLPEMRIVPSPPQVKDNKRKRRTKVQEKRKRRPKFDNEIVFSNVYMKKQIDGDELCNLVFKRRKLPQTAVDMWKFNRTSQKDMFLVGPLVYGMCTNLHETYERKFPRASDSDAESAADEGTASAANVGVRDASPERQLTPNSPGNADAPSELPAQKSPGNANARPECQLTSEPPGNADAAQYEDMAPELPRFSPQDIPSPTRDDDTPFKTPGGIPQSGRGGTGATEIPPADGTSVSPGQMTRGSDPKASPFPFDDELDGDLPEIPGLISTPGVISSAGTSATWLGSMSTRTRAVAQYFKDHMPSTTSDDQPGKFSLNRILEGRARKQAARMLFETLALKSYDYIDVHQEEAYGDIAVSVKPSLSAAKF